MDSVDEDDDIETLAQAEINKLHRQYRILEGKRKTYCEESEVTIRKQKNLLAHLETEKEDLQLSLKVAQSKKNVIKDQEYMEELSRLLHEQDFFKDLIKEEKDAIQKLEKELERLDKETINQAKQIKGKSGAEQVQQTEKQIRTMERRLEIATHEYNLMLTNNGKLRGEIEDLRIQRSMFDNLHKKLTKRLDEQKKLMQNIIDQSTAAYDERDDAQGKIHALKAKNEKDLVQYNYEYRELMRIIDHDAKLKSFMNTKGQERCDADDRARKNTGEADKAERTAKEMISTYERAFKTIRDITGEADMYALVKRYVETEEKNYALFTYINELNGELKTIEKQIEASRQEIRDYNEKGVTYQSERLKVLTDLEKKLEEAKEDEEKYARLLFQTETILKQLKDGIVTVFKEIHCDKSVLSQALGDNSRVNEDNILQYLSLIEEKTNELLQVHSYLQLKEFENRPSESDEPMKAPISVLGGPSAPPKKGPLRVVAPVIEEVDPDEEGEVIETEELDEPLSPAELKKQAIKNAVKTETA